jgi:hypothetical protein
MPNFNCACDDDHPNRTLGEMRVDLLRRLGYSAQAANPPPGMAELLNSFLNGAQRMVYRTYKSLRMERVFTWTMVPDERFYGIAENNESLDYEAPCLKTLDPYRVTWVGMEDLNGVWYPLREGIPPEMYTRADITPGWPQFYEIRSCIEVFPAPQAAYKLRVKGYFEAEEMVADEDKPAVDSEAVFLLALANAKQHYGQADAQTYFQQSFAHIQSLVAGSHNTARYIPGRPKPAPATPPVFLPVVE